MSKEKFEPKIGFIDRLQRTFQATKRNFWTRSFSTTPTSSTFQLRTLARVSKAGTYAALVSCVMLYGWDSFQQYKARIMFNSTRPKGKVKLEKTIAVGPDELDTWDYSQEHNLVERYGPGTMVKVGGGKKEGFKGLIPFPEWMEPSDEVRTIPLDKTAVCHVGIVVQPVDSDKDARPLIIGRQSTKGPLPTLKASIDAGWQQFVNPVKGKTITSAMKDALHATIQNESPHISKGTAFDMTVIQDLAIPVEYVEEALQSTERDLSPVMTFVDNNCMTTKSFALLNLARMVDEWADSDSENAPSRKKADAFITGCYEIIAEDIHARGYGVLNNSQVSEVLEDLGKKVKRIGHDQHIEQKTDLDREHTSSKRM